MSGNAIQKPAAELNVESASKELDLYDAEKKIGEFTSNPYITKLFTANVEYAKSNLDAAYLEKEATQAMRNIAQKKRENETTFNNGLDTLKSNIEGLSKKRREALALFTSTLDAELMQREELSQFYDRKNEFDKAFRPEQEAAREKVEQAATIRNMAVNKLGSQVPIQVTAGTPMFLPTGGMESPMMTTTEDDFGTRNLFTDNSTFGKRKSRSKKRPAKRSHKKVRFQKKHTVSQIKKKLFKSKFWQ